MTSRRSFLELQLGLSLTGFNAEGSYHVRTVAAAEVTFAGLIRPIVAVTSMLFPRELVRVERATDVVAGTWFYDEDLQVAGGSSDLYVCLPTGAAATPAANGCVVRLLFCFGGGDDRGRAEVHPLLGLNKFANGELETWVGAVPSGFNLYGAGAVRETSVLLHGLSSARIGSGAMPGSALDGIGQAGVGVQGKRYRVSGYYQTPATGNAPEVEVRLRVGDGLSFVASDGAALVTTSNGGFRLAETRGQTRRFIFDFIWTGTTTSTLQADVLLYNSSASAKAGLLYVDRLSFRRIWRWEVYDTRLSASSIPDLSIQSQSLLFGKKTIGFGSVTLLDADGDLARAFASLHVMQNPAQVYVGGSLTPVEYTFGVLTSEGEEIHRDDWRGVFPALIQKAEVSPGAITCELENAAARALAKLMERTYQSIALPTMARVQENQPKRLLFGAPSGDTSAILQHIIPPVRVALNASTGYGEYNILDDFIPIRDNVNVWLPTGYSIKSFPNEALANQNLQGYLISDNVNDFDVTTNNTRWRIKRDIRNLRYDHAGDDVGTDATFAFGIAGPAGAVLFANLDLSGPPYKCAADLAAAMNAAAAVANITVVYSETTHRMTIGRGAGTLDLFMTSARNPRAHVPSWKVFGYDAKADRTGALSYVADEPLFTSPETDHVIRMYGGGYRDDAAGSITGLASAVINVWPRIAAWVLQKRMGVDPSRVNVASVAAAADAAEASDLGQVFATFDEGEVDELLALAEQGSLVNIVPDGEGVWQFIRHTDGSAGARSFTDADYLAGSWRMWRDPAAVYREVRVLGDWNPSLRRFMIPLPSALNDPFIPIKYGDERVLEIETYGERNLIYNGLTQIQNYYARLIKAVPRVVSFEATSKLVDLLPGHKVVLSRTLPGVLDPSGVLTNVAFRIVALTHRYATNGSTRCVAVEDVTILS